MGIKSVFSKVGVAFKKIGGFIVDTTLRALPDSVYIRSGELHVDGSPEDEQLKDQIVQIAKNSVELVAGVDLDGDGRRAVAEEIVEAASQAGVTFGKKLLRAGREQAIENLSKHYDEDTLRRLLASARIAGTVIKRFGPAFLPNNRVINGLIEATLILDDQPTKPTDVK
ncbi:MAG: hypothetical protein AB1489_34090 [Acidobacteriota bacterium]